MSDRLTPDEEIRQEAERAQSNFEELLRKMYFKFAHLNSLLSNGDSVSMSSYNHSGGQFISDRQGKAKLLDETDQLIAHLCDAATLIATIKPDYSFDTTDGFLGIKDEIKRTLAYAEKLPQDVVNMLVKVLGAMKYFEYMQKPFALMDYEKEQPAQIPSPADTLLATLMVNGDHLNFYVWEGILITLGALEDEPSKSQDQSET